MHPDAPRRRWPPSARSCPRPPRRSFRMLRGRHRRRSTRSTGSTTARTGRQSFSTRTRASRRARRSTDSGAHPSDGAPPFQCDDVGRPHFRTRRAASCGAPAAPTAASRQGRACRCASRSTALGSMASRPTRAPAHRRRRAVALARPCGDAPRRSSPRPCPDPVTLERGMRAAPQAPARRPDGAERPARARLRARRARGHLRTAARRRRVGVRGHDRDRALPPRRLTAQGTTTSLRGGEVPSRSQARARRRARAARSATAISPARRVRRQARVGGRRAPRARV